jgi:cytochrome c-type biogenesis protein CcmH/NrfF
MRVFLAFLILMLAVPAAAQDPRPNAAVANEAISQLRSPYCPGLMLEVCPSEPAVVLRDSIRDLAAEGYTSSQLVEWMLSNHGEEWRGVPKRSGAGLWAWLIPPLALVLGAGFVVYRLRDARPDMAPPLAGPELTEADRSELAAALEELEEIERLERETDWEER